MKNKKNFSFLDVPGAIWFFLEKDRKKYLFFSILLLIALFIDFIPPYIIGKVVDFLTKYSKGIDVKPLYFFIIFIIISSAFAAIVRLSSKKALLKSSINARYRAKVWGFSRLLDFSMFWHQKENTGNKAQRILTGSESIREWTADIMNIIFPAVTSFIGSLAACILINPYFAIFFILYLLILILIELYFDSRISKISDQINKSLENASGVFVESASNILSVKALGANENMTVNIEKKEKIAQVLSHKRISLGITKWIFFQVHNSVSWGIFILIIAVLVMNKQMSIGLILTFSYYFNNLKRNSTDFTNQFQAMIEKKSNLARLMPYFIDDFILRKGNEKFPVNWQTIRLDNAVFAYNDQIVINNFNLKINRGQKIGIAGNSGSGKSTLIKLFLGLYHLNKGAFLIENVKIEDIKHEQLTDNISAVLQETELFNLSLKDNITLMRDISAALFERSVKIACLDEVIANLPQGIDTLIGERGYALSGGERQRVGIARAICKNPSIMLLDEATSALDSKTEDLVMSGLMKETENSVTMIIVAHRLSTLRHTDRIIVFKDGFIAEEGNFNSLRDDISGLFGSLYKNQYGSQ